MTERLRLIGVAGYAGAGKDTAAEIIARLYGVTNISGGDLARAVTRYVYDLPTDHNPVRDQLYIVANFLRDIDPALLVKVGILRANQSHPGETCVLSGLRSMGEADAIRAAGGIIVGVDADVKIRYERIYRRGRDSEAQKTFEQFLEQDAHENEGLADTGPGRGIKHIIESADIKLVNNTDVAALEAQIKDQLGPYFDLAG